MADIANFQPVTTPEQQEELAQLAGAIWHEYWDSRLGVEQTTYMVEQFQSLDAIRRDMAENGYEYWFVRAADDNRVVGYTGGHVEPETNRYFISKIYLKAEERGKHFSSAVARFFDSVCREQGLGAMYLTVNKHNELGMRAYRANGFETIDAVVKDIGHGFVMDDYIMERPVA